MLGYALGRSVQLSDEPLLDELVGLENPRVGTLIERMVCSPQFRRIRGQAVPLENGPEPEDLNP